VADGYGKVLVGDYTGQARSGEIYLVGPGVPHSFYTVQSPPVASPGMEFCVINADLERFANAMPGLAELTDLLETSRRGILFGDQTGTKVREILRRSSAAEGVGLAALTLEVLDVLAKATDGRQLVSPRCRMEINDREYRRVNAATQYLHQCYRRPVRLADVAARSHVSQPMLCRLFRRALGKTVVEYLNELRIDHACRLLAETDLPITAVAFDVGYNSLSNFNRMFMRLKQTTPRQFRNHSGPATRGRSDAIA